MKQDYTEEQMFIESEMKLSFMLEYGDDRIISQKKGPHDIVTPLDKKIESRLIDSIKQMYPDDNILSEETNPDTKISKRTWVIDPIDGTLNMSDEIPLFCTQCALMEDKSPVMSVIYIPMLNETYTAVKDKGVFLDHVMIQKRDVKENQFMVDVNHITEKAMDTQFDIIRGLSAHNIKTRMTGSVGVGLAYAAAEKLSGIVICNPKPWDVIPGFLLCKNAGCTISHAVDKDNNDFYVVTNNQEIENIIITAIQK